MRDLIATGLFAALGFLLGFFYTRTMRVVDKLPERYASKDDCREFRLKCSHDKGADRGEMMERMGRIESKIDRLIERLLSEAARGA
jgi:hypothetical protein